MVLSPEIGNVRIFMHRTPNAMADVIAHNAVTVQFGKRLHRMSDITEPIPGASSIKTRPHAFLSHIKQRADLLGN